MTDVSPGSQPKLVLTSLDEVRDAIGKPLGYGDWLTITQERINAFADATGDHQWIHLDAERAADGPFGATIAHGFLTLSLLPLLAADIFTIEGPRMVINYGLNKVRFPNPVIVGSRVRADASILSVDEKSSGVQVVVGSTVEIEGSDRPACVAESVRLLKY